MLTIKVEKGSQQADLTFDGRLHFPVDCVCIRFQQDEMGDPGCASKMDIKIDAHRSILKHGDVRSCLQIHD